MKVRMKEQILGLRNGQRWPAPGGVVEVLDHEGARLIARGSAEVVVEEVRQSAEKRPAAKKSAEKRG